MEEDVNINASVLQSSLNLQEKLPLFNDNPFIESEGQVVTPVGYVYKLWNLGKGRRICIRCTVHNYVSKPKLLPKDGEEDKEEDKRRPKQVDDYKYVLGT